MTKSARSKISALIDSSDGEPFVLSTTVAQEFGRRHTNVLRTLDDLVEDGTIDRLNFEPITYTDNRSRGQRAYRLDERAFLIAMPFIGGKKAREGQKRLVDAFFKFRRSLVRQAKKEWQQARAEGKVARHRETKTIKTFVEYATAQGSKNAARYYVNLTKMTYKALFIVEQGMGMPNKLRDMLNGMQLSFLTTAEYVCANALKDGMDQGMHYKDIYRLAHDRVENYAISVGRTPALHSPTMASIGTLH